MIALGQALSFLTVVQMPFTFCMESDFYKNTYVSHISVIRTICHTCCSNSNTYT